MSKKCCDNKHFSSERGESRSFDESSSSKRKPSRSRREASRGRSSSSKSRKSKRNSKTKKLNCESEKSSSTDIRSIEKKTRIEHFADGESVRSGASEVKKREKKNQQGAKKKKIKKKRKKKKTDRKKLSGSSARSRLIELLLKSCSCLESLDSSSYTFPNGDNTCCCKCRFCRPDCESKSVQCDDCDNFVASSRPSSSHELRDYAKETNEEIDKSWECFAREESVASLKKNDFRVDFRGREEEEEVSKIRAQKRNNKSDTGICRSLVRSFSAFKNCGKRRISTKSLIDDRQILKNESSKMIPPSKKMVKPVEIETKNCELARPCGSGNRSKSTKALLIMFDIIFWPYTCLPGRQSFDNKNSKR